MRGVVGRSDPVRIREGSALTRCSGIAQTADARQLRRRRSDRGDAGGTQLVPTQRLPESSVVVIAQTSMASVGEQENPLEEAMHAKLLYRIPEVVAILNVSRSKVYELLSSGTLPSVHIDRTRLVRHEDLVLYVESLPKAG